MFYPILSILKNTLSNDRINRLDEWLYYLSPPAKHTINSCKVSIAIQIDLALAEDLLSILVNNHFLKQEFAISCPTCGMLLKKIELSDFTKLIKEISYCYACEENIDLCSENIEVIYSIIESPDYDPFDRSQCSKIIELKENKTRALVNYNSFKTFVNSKNGLNSIVYAPNEKDYKRLEIMFNEIFKPQKNTTKTGATLESIIKVILDLCSCFKAGDFKTTTNQIDCAARNILGDMELPVLKYIGNLFIIECKNEKRTPKGEYMQKLKNIIDLTNNGSDFIKFGIIVSKTKKPSTFTTLSNKYYLHNKAIIISFDSEDLKSLIINKENLLDMIERKCIEVITDATKDLRVSGLF